jgi:hypothetical protein
MVSRVPATEFSPILISLFSNPNNRFSAARMYGSSISPAVRAPPYASPYVSLHRPTRSGPLAVAGAWPRGEVSGVDADCCRSAGSSRAFWVGGAPDPASALWRAHHGPFKRHSFTRTDCGGFRWENSVPAHPSAWAAGGSAAQGGFARQGTTSSASPAPLGSPVSRSVFYLFGRGDSPLRAPPGFAPRWSLGPGHGSPWHGPSQTRVSVCWATAPPLPHSAVASLGQLILYFEYVLESGRFMVFRSSMLSG